MAKELIRSVLQDTYNLDKGGIDNTMVQVANIERDLVLQIDSKLFLNAFETYSAKIK